jgi:NADPH2:quinone reductase
MREEFVRSAKKLFEFILKDNIKGTMHKVYPLPETSRAQADLEGRLTAGKLLLKA